MKSKKFVSSLSYCLLKHRKTSGWSCVLCCLAGNEVIWEREKACRSKACI